MRFHEMHLIPNPLFHREEEQERPMPRISPYAAM